MSEATPMVPLLRSERDQLSLDLARVRSAFNRGRRAALVVFVLIVTAGALGIVFAERTYDIDAIVVAADVPGMEGLESLGSLASLAATVGIGNLPKNSVNEALAVLTSRTLIGSFITTTQLKPKLFRDDWDSESGAWRTGLLRTPPTDVDAYEYFMEEVLDVRNDPISGLVTIRVTWRDPDEAAAWANELVDLLNAEMRRKAIKDADDMMRFLEQELAKTQHVSIRQSIFGLLESQLNAKAVANVREEFALRFVDRAVSKDEKNFDHPRIGLLAVLVVFAAVVAAIVAGIAWGGIKAKAESRRAAG